MTLRQEDSWLTIQRAVRTIIAEKNIHGGARLSDFAQVGRSTSQVRKHLQALQASGDVVRNQVSGPGTRYFLAGTKRRRYWAVVVDDRGRELGRVELPERLADGDGASERRTVDLGRQLGELIRKGRRR